jgi:hypothetical protein
MSGARAASALSCVFGTAVAVVVFAHALQKPLDHDEHQFVASATLVAREGLIPYRDFPYFHLPYLSYLYAPVVLFNEHLLASMRAVSATAALGIALLVWLRAHAALATLPALLRAGGAAACVLALVTNPLFLYTAGRAWNHDVALLAALAAALAVGSIPTAKRPIRAALVGGLSIGFAIGTRSTMALVAPALLVSAVFVSRDHPSATRPAILAALGGGVAIALLPLLFFLAIAPSEFVYGNLTYNLTLNPLYRERMGYDLAMSHPQKVEYLVGSVLSHPRMVALLLAYAVSVALLLAAKDRAQDREKDRAKHRRLRSSADAFTLGVCSPMILVAALLPTPTWYQYYYAVVPFLLLGVIANYGALRSPIARGVAALAAVPMLAGALTGARHYLPFVTAPSPGWAALAIHEAGREVAAAAGTTRVVTLGPIFPLEGHALIYPALATGAFAWRTTPLVAAAEREKLGLLGPDELGSLATDPAFGAMLTGVERDPAENLEAALLDFATTRKWKSRTVGEDLTLWTRPRE